MMNSSFSRTMLAATAFLALLGVAFGGAEDSSRFGAMVRVMGPNQLRIQLPYNWTSMGPAVSGTGRIESRPSFFGKPEYGHPTTGTLVYPYRTEADGCSKIEPDLIERWPHNQPGRDPSRHHPVVVMVDRGSCYFTDKVRHIQNACNNARNESLICKTPVAALIVDNRPATGPDFALPYMAAPDDVEVKIPAMIISQENGAILKQLLNDPTYTGEVIIQMSWSLPRPDNRVEWELWYNPYDLETAEIFRGAKRVNQAMGEDALFIPHMQVIEGWRYSCEENFPACFKQCSNRGRYCEVDPDRNTHEGLDGLDIIEEGMRQQCVWIYDNGYSIGDEVVMQPQRPKVDAVGRHRASELFFDYVGLWHEHCFPQRFAHRDAATFMKQCATRQLQRLQAEGSPGLVAFVTQTCFNGFGTLTYEADNGLRNFDFDISRRGDLGLFPTRPVLAINEFMYTGTLQCKEAMINEENCGVLEAICSGFNSTVPAACRGSAGCDLGQTLDVCNVCGGDGTSCLGCDGIPNSGKAKDRCGKCGGDGTSCPKEEASSGGVTGVIVAIVSISVIAVAVGIFFIVRRQRLSEQRIDDILAQYSPLEATPARDAKQTLMPANAPLSTADDDDDQV